MWERHKSIEGKMAQNIVNKFVDLQRIVLLHHYYESQDWLMGHHLEWMVAEAGVHQSEYYTTINQINSMHLMLVSG